ncbi:MAG: hypothetical protein DPW09_25720 [Anaerolineae bacterium]|nr:pentapeptide repeat-containing protein [Anaerolineales bacterium]MCQ3976840.1 hypothetical protein [Anaerolineae bacterium]
MAEASLFDSLRRSKEDGGSTYLENYFTKIVVHLFKTSPEILFTWLKYIQFIDDSSQYVHVEVLSERPCEGGRIDIQLELIDSSRNRDLIFLESKINSREHNDQLHKYAKHLSSQLGFRNKFLLYVTRDRDEKDEEKILEGIINPPKFVPIRWHTLQEVLQNQPKNPLLDEIIIFMERNGMGDRNKLTKEVERINLSGANLSGATLSGVDLSRTNLSSVNLTNANLSGTNLIEANLRAADLRRANLSGANLSGADLRESDGREAKLNGVNLSSAYLAGIDLRGANLSGANLFKADLRRLRYDHTTLWPEGFSPPVDAQIL